MFSYLVVAATLLELRLQEVFFSQSLILLVPGQALSTSP
jgi:hypothetical protein